MRQGEKKRVAFVVEALVAGKWEEVYRAQAGGEAAAYRLDAAAYWPKLRVRAVREVGRC